MLNNVLLGADFVVGDDGFGRGIGTSRGRVHVVVIIFLKLVTIFSIRILSIVRWLFG